MNTDTLTTKNTPELKEALNFFTIPYEVVRDGWDLKIDLNGIGLYCQEVYQFAGWLISNHRRLRGLAPVTVPAEEATHAPVPTPDTAPRRIGAVVRRPFTVERTDVDKAAQDLISIEAAHVEPKKVSIATLKAALRRARKTGADVYVKVKSEFDGMTDGLAFYRDAKLERVTLEDENNRHSLGVPGAYFVGSSRDYIYTYFNDTYQGFNVSNSCGSFNIVIKK